MRSITTALLLSLPLVALSATNGHRLRQPALRHRAAAAAYAASDPQGVELARAVVGQGAPKEVRAVDADKSAVGNETRTLAAQSLAENTGPEQRGGQRSDSTAATDRSNFADNAGAATCAVTLSSQSGTRTNTKTFTIGGQGVGLKNRAPGAEPAQIKRGLQEERDLATRQAAAWIADAARSCLGAVAAARTIHSGVVACSSIGYLDREAGEFGSHLSVFRIGSPPPLLPPAAASSARLEFTAPCGEPRRTAPGAIDLLRTSGFGDGVFDAANPRYRGFVGGAEAVMMGSFHMNERVHESGRFAPDGMRWFGHGMQGVELHHLDLTKDVSEVESRRWGMFDRRIISSSGRLGKRARGDLQSQVLADSGCRVTGGVTADPFFASSNGGSGSNGNNNGGGNNGGNDNGGNKGAGAASVASTTPSATPSATPSTTPSTPVNAAVTTTGTTSATSTSQAPATGATAPSKGGGGGEGGDANNGSKDGGESTGDGAAAPQVSGIGGNVISTGMVQATAPNAVAAAAASATVVAAAESASSSSFQLPGRNLQVLPIGLGIFAGISVLALTIVGVVTYERRKYRDQYRERKTREQISQAGGFGRMSEARV